MQNILLAINKSKSHPQSVHGLLLYLSLKLKNVLRPQQMRVVGCMYELPSSSEFGPLMDAYRIVRQGANQGIKNECLIKFHKIYSSALALQRVKK